MLKHKLDPNPRSYAPFVYLVERSQRGPDCAPQKQTIADVTDWLLHDATKIDSLMLMFEEFMWRCRTAGIPVDRSSLHVGTLHPRVVGISWVWNSTDCICDEVIADVQASQSPSYTLNPLAKVMEFGEPFQVDLRTEEGRTAFPFMKELAEEGYTLYAITPLSSIGSRQNAITFASKHPEGFPESIQRDTKVLMDVFALQIERHILLRIARNVVDTYLGPSAGARVLNGEIRRGDGEAIDAVVWMSDLRGFTSLSDRLEGAEVSSILNTYFEIVSNAVLDEGGDILKFIGDGILAVFPQDQLGTSAAAERALAAARRALSDMAKVNDNPPDGLRAIAGWHPLKFGVALHEGEVFFGNIGGETRLDFTVIGRTVNETSRVEALCKELGRPLLLTEPVFSRLSEPLKAELEAMGVHKLRGVERSLPVYACPLNQSAAVG